MPFPISKGIDLRRSTLRLPDRERYYSGRVVFCVLLYIRDIGQASHEASSSEELGASDTRKMAQGNASF